jgi:hypothetical protein
MKYAVEMGSDSMICIRSFIKIGSGIQKLIGAYTDTERYKHKDTRREQCDFISLLLFFQNKKSRLKIT